MLRLIKLAIYAGAAYAIYEIVQGMLGEQQRQHERAYGSKEFEHALNSDEGRLEALTGRGVGVRVETLDRDGGSVPHQVGRGVLVQ